MTHLFAVGALFEVLFLLDFLHFFIVLDFILDLEDFLLVLCSGWIRPVGVFLGVVGHVLVDVAQQLREGQALCLCLGSFSGWLVQSVDPDLPYLMISEFE